MNARLDAKWMPLLSKSPTCWLGATGGATKVLPICQVMAPKRSHPEGGAGCIASAHGVSLYDFNGKVMWNCNDITTIKQTSWCPF